MSNIQFKQKTIDMVGTMIRRANKGPSGFWVDDGEGCGNPGVFPEFEEGLRKGRLIQKEHYLCPWNTAVLFGDKEGDIRNGCYYSCSIGEARYLSTDMLRNVLIRFRDNMEAGVYDDLEHIEPLLTEEEQNDIAAQKEQEEQDRKRKWEEDRERRRKAAAGLLKKYSDDEGTRNMILANYGENTQVQTEFGILDFSPEGAAEIVSRKELSYDEYLDIQLRSQNCRQRDSFLMCYLNFPIEFKGKVEKKREEKICFQRIFVTGMYQDDCSFFDGKEDHVWMDISGFEDLEVGDSVSFLAEVYRYVKTGHGKQLDYGLRNPSEIRKIEAYQLPSDEELIRQELDGMVCETCCLSEQCDRMLCMRNPEELRMLKEQMLEMIEGNRE